MANRTSIKKYHPENLKKFAQRLGEFSGWGLTDEYGNWYRLPQALPEVPAGAFVVILFVGQGSDSDDSGFSLP